MQRILDKYKLSYIIMKKKNLICINEGKDELKSMA